MPNMQCGKADDTSIQRTWDIYHDIQTIIDDWWRDDSASNDQYLNDLYVKLQTLDHHLPRILVGYETLVNSCCDKSLDYLDFKKSMQVSFELAEHALSHAYTVLPHFDSQLHEHMCKHCGGRAVKIEDIVHGDDCLVGTYLRAVEDEKCAGGDVVDIATPPYSETEDEEQS